MKIQTTTAFVATLLCGSASAVSYTPFYYQMIEYQSGNSTIIFGKDPAVYISASASNQASVVGTIGYSFLISGGPANSFVPIDFMGNFSLLHQGNQPGGNRWSQARFAIAASDYVDLGNGMVRGAGLLLTASCNQQAGGGCGSTQGMLPGSNYVQTGESFITTTYYGIGAASLSGLFSGVLYAPTDSLGQARGSVNLLAAAGSYTTQASTTFLDPHFEINAAWLANNPGAAFTLPAGVGNEVVPVPEPATWLLALGGLAFLATRRIAST